jgi:hypothetical protein
MPRGKGRAGRNRLSEETQLRFLVPKLPLGTNDAKSTQASLAATEALRFHDSTPDAFSLAVYLPVSAPKRQIQSGDACKRTKAQEKLNGCRTAESSSSIALRREKMDRHLSQGTNLAE